LAGKPLGPEVNLELVGEIKQLKDDLALAHSKIAELVAAAESQSDSHVGPGILGPCHPPDGSSSSLHAVSLALYHERLLAVHVLQQERVVRAFLLSETAGASALERNASRSFTRASAAGRSFF